MWISPDKYGLTPNYGSLLGSEYSMKNQWAHIVSSVTNKTSSTPVKIHSDCNIFVAELDEHQVCLFSTPAE
jgi:hypothetical protein